jgi:CRISPR system Cascade subunit CasC
MTNFVQLHLLTAYPPANLNRDDTNRPKTAQFGGMPRLRISSQALKRAWRTSDVFERRLTGHLGQRTQRFGEIVKKYLTGKDVAEDKAHAVARQVADVFGKLKSEKDKNATYTEQLAFISPEERDTALALADKVLAGEVPKVDNADVLRTADTAVDIAMFGRMLADDPNFNREAAVQVGHAITTHPVVVEDDYYTAVDDLKTPAEDAGAGFVGELGFGSGVFYLYVCIDRDLLERNLGGDGDLAGEGIAALVEAAATVGPRGKQASFASRARASFAMVEKGETAPRTLAAAFVKRLRDTDDLLAASIDALKGQREHFAKVYGDVTDARHFDVAAGEGTLDELVAFARS